MRFNGYKYTFKINAMHKTNAKGTPHSHTFEITVYIQQDRSFLTFNEAEEIIGLRFETYSGRIINEIPPFDIITPTVENMGRVFFDELSKDLDNKGFKLFQLDFSETANRIFSINSTESFIHKKRKLDRVIALMDEIEPDADEKTDFILPFEEHEEIIIETTEKKPENKEIKPEEKAPLGAFIKSVFLIILGGFIVMEAVKISGLYPLGFDIHGHLFKSDFMYNEIIKGNLYPLYTQYWYNGLQLYRYWPPMTYYFMALLQFLTSGDVMKAYLGFIWASFFIGGLGWLLLGRSLNKPKLGLFMAAIWFFLPDNMRVFFSEGNMPRMFITMLIPLIFYSIWQFVNARKKKMIFPIIILMTIAVLGHLMISAMIGVGTFVFLSIYSFANKRAEESVYAILAMLFSFALAGIWVYPSLVGGITAMDSGGTSQLMASLSTKLAVSLNPFNRSNSDITELYFGLSIAFISSVGLFLSSKKSLSGFLAMIIVILGTTTALTPIIQKIPFSELFWVRRFTPIAYAMFIIAVFEWRNLKTALVVIVCLIIALDCIPSANLEGYEEKMEVRATLKDIPKTMQDCLFADAKEITKQRVSLMDLSGLGPLPSYAFSSLDKKVPYVFGWAWQGASTADNIVRLNEALEKQNFDFLFDRNFELGADTVIIDKRQIKADNFEKLDASAQRLGYKLAGETNMTKMYCLYADGNFGVKTKYNGISIGTTSSIVPLILTYYGTGDKNYIDDYTYEELSHYERIYLSGFFYRSKANAENLIKSLAESGIKIYIDMSNIPSDPLTTRMTFLDVSAQPITFNQKFPRLITEDSIVECKNFVQEYSQWNTVYLNGLDNSLGYAWFKDIKLDFIGKKGNENITFIGFNLLYHAMTAMDDGAYSLLSEVMGLNENSLPLRETVPLKITYDINKITIVSDKDNVNTTIAYQDNFKSDRQIRNLNNLLFVDKGTTVINMHYPYLYKSLAVTGAGIFMEGLLILSLFRKRTIIGAC